MNGFSLNQATTKRWPLDELVAGCVAAGVPAVGLWREEVAEYGLDKTATLVRDAGLEVSSLCRGRLFHEADWYDHNRRAIDEAHTLGPRTRVRVRGATPARSTTAAGAAGTDPAASPGRVPTALPARARR